MERMMVVIRHGQSEWNLKKLFTGWRDPGLTEKGIGEAIEAGRQLAKRDIAFDIAYTSLLQRAQKTCELVLGEMGQDALETIRARALNERNYGDLSGLNKDDARARWGKEQVHIWRRSYDVAPPGADGESLRDTGARVWPYYLTEILPRVMVGNRVLVAAHGNSLRALAMVLDRLSKDEVTTLEIATGVPIIYRFNADTTVASREIFEI